MFHCLLALMFFATENPADHKVPAGVILVKGAAPSASDSKAPLPEDGRFKDGSYVNSYFGLTVPLPAGWAESFKGPPPSDSGSYVLAQLKDEKGKSKATIVITAQDQFFSLIPARSAIETVKLARERLQPELEVVRPPAEVRIGDRTFARFDYRSPVADLHWVIVTTEARCHTLQFTFIGRDAKLLDGLVDEIDKSKLLPDDLQPRCVAGYADVTYKVDPVLTDHRHNAIPVRIIIDKDGRVKHVHVISAFEEQSAAITKALLQWRFKPYVQNGEPVEVETGMMLH
jgi:Gram-negative bacterial TonB protein C-terminal